MAMTHGNQSKKGKAVPKGPMHHIAQSNGTAFTKDAPGNREHARKRAKEASMAAGKRLNARLRTGKAG